ncbi:MerR family transcriptional regulator [Myceligenerans xiligouense]|uniref:DNA-binding transcriptional MerR regulator n=1 Tax=Myceligenerans xiligouense TaxID=253184 RepID=A0A3N4YKF4_9MICO|nr:MerR family transcriptional regulator [Myceligenerans xiligouense]RPF21589.1 DNA-binding transcriptional MerR regulator [Myceligenerans xiligouense]
MRSGAARRAADDPRPVERATGQDTEPWPRGISRQATMRISDVLRALAPEFGDVSHSKLRFLEEQGLITPVRTPSGYRQYSQADVERLRYVLTEQRDSYLPLKVIKERLAAMDAGDDEARPAPRLAPDEPSARRRWTREQVAEAAGASPELVDDLIRAGAVEQSGQGTLGAGSVDVVRIAVALAEHGIEPRHLRTLRGAADRQVALAGQVVAPWRGRQSSSARGEAAAMATEIGELLTRLHAIWVRQGVADL